MTEPPRKRGRRRGGEDLRRRPPLYVTSILAWADAFHQQTGHWPNAKSGPIPESPGDTWGRVHKALIEGLRGLPGGSSLPRLLAEQRGVRNHRALPPYTVEQILAWSDRHFERTGTWPTQRLHDILDAPGETWHGVDVALTQGRRGLPGGSSLARLLEEQRGVRNLHNLPPFSRKQILEWADAFHARTGQWPHRGSGAIAESPGDTWGAVDTALVQGKRGLRGGSSLARVLKTYRGVRHGGELPPLTEEQILDWAKAYHQEHGKWPAHWSGTIGGSDGETWSAVNSALVRGRRGLLGGSSLARLLAERGLKRNQMSQPDLSYTRILRWADRHQAETGQWPKNTSGKIQHTRGEKWENVDRALRHGLRGLPGGSSLAQLLESRRGVPNKSDLPELSYVRILAWADAYQARSGEWPKARSEAIAEAPGETWVRVDMALRIGHRGLPGGSSLARLLAEQRGVVNKRALPPLRLEQVMAWAQAHQARTGQWPVASSGPVAEAPGETWIKIDGALRKGLRGLPGGSSLRRLQVERRDL
jgi:hypothetical protein